MSPGLGGRPTSVSREDTDALVVVVRDDIELARLPLPGSAYPDLAVVETVALLQLAMRRFGCSVGVRDASIELVELLDLVGLKDVVAVALRQVGGETEGGEQARVDEVVVPDDPVA
jgi:hypothetical protein